MMRAVGYAVRALRWSPGFTVTALLTLAIGIGANTAMFAVLYGVLLKPLPYLDPDRLISITAETYYGGAWQLANYSASDLDAWQSPRTAFERVAASAGMSVAMRQRDGSVSIDGAYVSPTFFDTIGGHLSAGRFPLAAEHRIPVALISDRLWRTAFAADPRTVGQPIVLDGRAYTIVGVAAPEFALPNERLDVWIPADYAATAGADWIANPRGGGFNLIARLKDAATLEAARASADAIARTSDFRPVVQPLSAALTDSARPVLLPLFVAVALVLVVACVNLANLQSVRNVSRRRELAILAAIGARRSDLLLRACGEASVLGVGGAALGLLLARALVAAVLGLPGVALPRVEFVDVGLPAVAFAAAITAVTLAVSSAAALGSAEVQSALQTLRDGSRTGRPAGTRLRQILVTGELVACVVLLIGSLLLARTLDNLLHVDTGVAADHVLAALVDLGQEGATAADDRQVTTILQKLRLDPRVQSAAVSTSLPPSVTRARIGFSMPGRDAAPADYMADMVPSSPELFRTLRIPILEGREFSEHDGANSRPVAVVSRSTADRLFGSGDPVGRTLPLGARRPRPTTIVGVVADVKYHGLTSAPPLTVYVPFAQRSFPFRVLNVLVRTAGDPDAFAPDLRHVLSAVAPQISLISLQPLEDVVSSASDQPAFRTLASAAMTVTAILLSLVGMAGVISYSVSQRTREIGVRMALGASGGAIYRMVIGEAARLGAAGIGIGLPAALASSRLLSAQLYGVTAADPLSFAGAALLVSLLTLAASYIPARRASIVDPAVALRAE